MTCALPPPAGGPRHGFVRPDARARVCQALAQTCKRLEREAEREAAAIIIVKSAQWAPLALGSGLVTSMGSRGGGGSSGSNGSAGGAGSHVHGGPGATVTREPAAMTVFN